MSGGPRILCNLPLECFDARDSGAWGDVELCTFGPGNRMWVDGRHWPFDVEFDPSRQSIEELWQRLPDGFEPDFLLIWWPDQEPVPDGLERCPVPVVGVISDYNLTLPYIAGLWPLFDLWLCDRAGVELFERLSFADVRWWNQYSFKAIDHHPRPELGRDIDVAFAGNLNPSIQAERAPWIDRVRAVAERGPRVEVVSGVFGPGYGELLARARIGFNRSIRGEMNLRAFEIPACGALQLVEAENLEVRDFFEPGEEVVLYESEGDHLEHQIERYLRDEAERARIAANGQRRVQDHRMGRRIQALADLVAEARPHRRTDTTPLDHALARGVAMLSGWGRGEAAWHALRRAQELAPDDPRPWHALGCARLQVADDTAAAQAAQLFDRAARIAPGHVPAVHALVELLSAAGRADDAARFGGELERRLGAGPKWPDLDGPWLPLGFSPRSIALGAALARAVRAGTPEPIVAELAGAPTSA